MERPEPAVGQVWRDIDGIEFAIFDEDYNTGLVAVYSDGRSTVGLVRVCDDDVYVGPFAGFEVKEGGK